MMVKKIKYFFYPLMIMMFFSTSVLSNIFIISTVNGEIITNIDIDSETKYLMALNPSIKKLSESEIYDYAKNSIINEKIKKYEIEKFYTIEPNEELLVKIISDIHISLGIETLDEFKNYLKENFVSFDQVKKKLSIEIAWNDLIIDRFQNEIVVDIKKIKDDIENKMNVTQAEKLLLSEIIFTVNEKKNIENKFNELIESIEKIGFEETARIYSLSDSRKDGGKIGWVYSSELSNEIYTNLSKIKTGEYTEPIVAPGGFIILKLIDKKLEEVKVDKKDQLNRMIEFERNKQLTRFSTLYYKRVFNNAVINEK
mgnify:CR=1 FL=1